jgi:hypothetical protein
MSHLVSHRPHGIEHPYATSIDQRIPVLPLDGESVRLGVAAEQPVVAVRCELETTHGGRTTSACLDLSPQQASAADAAALAGGDGHLAEAQAASIGGEGGWAVDTPPLSADAAHRYRFTAVTDSGDAQTSDWFDLVAARWVSQGGMLTGADDRLVEGSVEWLVSSQGTHGVRFALALSPGDHVVGFGERYDAVDQRGRRLDAVVFEQYKTQGLHSSTEKCDDWLRALSWLPAASRCASSSA